MLPFLCATGGPAGRQRLVGIATENEIAQGEVFTNIFARRRIGIRLQPVLHLLEGREANEPFMLGLTQRCVPILLFEITRIDDPLEEFWHPLLVKLSIGPVLGIGALTLQITLDFHLGLKAA